MTLFPSMESVEDICNSALGNLGITTKEIQNFETDRSVEASVCRRNYGPLLLRMLRFYSWPWATRYAFLALVEENPNDQWLFSYRYPSDCLFFRRIWNGTGVDDEKTRVRYEMASDEDGVLIYTNQQDALGIYTRKDIDPAQMTDDFKWGFSLLMAGWMAPALPGNGSKDLRVANLQLGKMEMDSAIARAANEQTPPIEMLSTMQKARIGTPIGVINVNGFWEAVPESFTP